MKKAALKEVGGAWELWRWNPAGLAMASIPRNLRDTFLPAKGAAGFWERQNRRETISRESGGKLSGLGGVPTETKGVAEGRVLASGEG